MADLPELSESTKRKRALQWSALLERQGLTKQDVARFDRDRNSLSQIVAGRGKDPKRAISEIGLGPTVRVAVAQFRGIDSEYWVQWCASRTGYETYADWLGTLKNETLADLKSVWSGCSLVTDRWFDGTCAPAIEKALADVAKSRIAQARDVEIERLDKVPTQAIRSSKQILDEIYAGGDNLSQEAKSALALAGIPAGSNPLKLGGAPVGTEPAGVSGGPPTQFGSGATKAMNLTPQQKDLLIAIVDGHEAYGGSEFIFVASQTGSALCYAGGLPISVTASAGDFQQLWQEKLINLLEGPGSVLRGRPTEFGIQTAATLRGEDHGSTNKTAAASGGIHRWRGRAEAFLDANNPKFMYHAINPPVQVFSEQEQADLGPEWSETYIFQAYPKCKYHRTGKDTTVKNADEEVALGEGWGDSPNGPFGPPDADPLRWFEAWDLEGLNPEARARIRNCLANAHADVIESSPQDGDRVRQVSMRKAFDSLAEEYLAAGLLTESMMADSIPEKVYDAAVAGGWQTGALERNTRCTLQFGRYWVTENVPKVLRQLFEPQVWRLRGKIGAGVQPEPLPKSQVPRDRRERQKGPSGAAESSGTRKTDSTVTRIKDRVRKLRAEGLGYQDICARLKDSERPPRASWRELTWPAAYKRHTSAVTKWLSEACTG